MLQIVAKKLGRHDSRNSAEVVLAGAALRQDVYRSKRSCDAATIPACNLTDDVVIDHAGSRAEGHGGAVRAKRSLKFEGIG
jgi:hypothetical protein